MTDDPCNEIVIDGATISPDILSTQVTRRENGIDDATLTAFDEEGKSYLGSLNLGVPVVISYKYADGDNIWHSVFKGTIEELAPNMSKAGEVVSATAYGLGYPLKCSVIATEIGSDSDNPTVDTVGKGVAYVIANYVNKLFGDTILDFEGNHIESGYTLQPYYTSVIGPDSISYVKFKYQDCFTAMQDLMKLAGSARYNADPVDWTGLHWIVSSIEIEGLPKYPWIFFAPVGNHDFGFLETYWPSHPITDPIEVKSDFINSSFVVEPFEANFVAVSGRYVYPNKEFFTENHASEWHFEWEDEDGNVTDEETIVRKGDHSVNLRSFKDANFWFDIPHMNIYAIGTEDDIPKLDFWVFRNGTNISVRLFTTWDRYFEADIKDLTEQGDPDNYDKKLWTNVSLEIGPYLKENNNIWTMHGTPDPDWHEICNIGFYLSGVQPMDAYIDGLQLVGSVVCCAYDSTSIAANGVKMLTIKDSLASLHTIDTTASDYAECSLAQTALGELNRNRFDMLSGKIIIPLDPHIMGGQLVHIHASKKPDDSFQIDQDMRITTVQHSFSNSSAVSILTLISDLKSSVPRTNANSNQYNQIINAIDPKHQTKTLASLSTGGDFDPKLTRVCKDYPS